MARVRDAEDIRLNRGVLAEGVGFAPTVGSSPDSDSANHQRAMYGCSLPFVRSVQYRPEFQFSSV